MDAFAHKYIHHVLVNVHPGGNYVKGERGVRIYGMYKKGYNYLLYCSSFSDAFPFSIRYVGVFQLRMSVLCLPPFDK